MSRPAVFLDRDGTLIEDREYLSDPAGVCLLPGVPEGLLRLRDAGFALVVVTNQSGIGRGWMTEDNYLNVAAELDRHLAAYRVALDAAYFCPAAPNENHSDRKPAPGMFLRAARELDLDLGRSFSVGDSLRDVVAGRAAGCRDGILVATGKPLPEAESLREWHVVADFRAAVEEILKA